MDNGISNPLSGTIGLNWPGKHSRLTFQEGKWHLTPFSNTEEKRALLYDERISNGEKCLGYAIKADIMTALKTLHSYVPSSVQFVYFDAPRLSAFQSLTESGYSMSTWLSLISQAGQRAFRCLKLSGFFAVHTDEAMSHYARVVLDEIYGRSHYVGTFAWQKQYSPQNDLNVPTDVLDYICVYSKMSAVELPKIGISVTPQNLKDDGDFRGVYTEGHKGARSGNEATKFHINTSPYHWEILDSDLPEGRWHFDKILGSLWFESVNTLGDFHVTVRATDKQKNIAEKRISFSVREPESVNDEYKIYDRIWWLMKNDNDIVSGGDLTVSDLPSKELVAVKGQEYSLVFKAEGGHPFTMRSDAPGVGRYWEFGKKTLIEGIARAKASFGSTGNSLPSIKKFYDRDNAKKLQTVVNLLPWQEFGHTQDATQHCKALKAAGITDGEINMMAKPQKLLAHLISLFAPSQNSLVLSIGDTNGVCASVAMKLRRRFIHITGISDDELATWNFTASRRIEATIDGKDVGEVEANDTLPDAKPEKGHVVVLSASASYLVKNDKNGDIEPYFSNSEEVEDFYAGLAGAYRSETGEYKSIDGRTVVVVPGDEVLDPVMLDRIRRSHADAKRLIIIYESADQELGRLNGVLRVPFELI